MDIKNVLYNSVKELPVTLEEIRFKAKFDKLITEKKNEIIDQKKNKGNNIFSICNGIYLYGDCVVIPAVLTKKIRKDFHIRHSGISKMKALMRSYVYWYGMDMKIENLVKTCKNCTLAAKAPPVKIHHWPKTDKPWSVLHIDYVSPIKGIYYFIVVNNFTKWLEVFKCKTSTSSVMICLIWLTRNYCVQQFLKNPFNCTFNIFTLPP